MPRSKKRGASKSAASEAAAVGEEVLATVEGAPKGRRTRGGASQSPAPQKASPSPAPRSRWIAEQLSNMSSVTCNVLGLKMICNW